ncbi:hypothetical protein ACWJW6_14700 [Clostridioides difficile]
MENFWNPLTCFTVCVMIYAFSEFLSKKTKGAISTLLFVCIIFLLGFWTNILPKDITGASGILAAMSNFGIALLITNLGTLINLEDLCHEWKTVVIALVGIVGIGVGCLTVGSMLFGIEYALIAAPPIAGSTVAVIIVTTVAEAANRPELAAFVILVLSFQKFFGIPITTYCINKELKFKRDNGDFLKDESKSNFKLPSMRIFKEDLGKKSSTLVYLAKLSFVAMIGNFVGLATLIPGFTPANYYLNPNIACLLVGLIFTRIGFLEKGILDKSQSNGIIMFGCMLMLPGGLAKVTPTALFGMIVPTIGILVVGSVFIILFTAIVGKLLGYSPRMSAAIGVTCMLAYPATQIISNEGIDAMEGTEEEKQRATDYLLPKMIIGGFVTVTIASVAFASIIGPIIFG